MKFPLAIPLLLLTALGGLARGESNPDTFGRCMYHCQQLEQAARVRCIETLCGSLAAQPQWNQDLGQNNIGQPTSPQQQELNSLAVQIAQAEARVEAARLRIEETRPRTFAMFDPFAVAISRPIENHDLHEAREEFQRARTQLRELQDRAQMASSGFLE